MNVPRVEYAKTPDGFHIAYQTHGYGDAWIVNLTEPLTSIDAMWEHPGHIRFHRFMGDTQRVILLDLRGTGLSDPVAAGEVGDLDAWCVDVETVMDAVGVESAVISGESFGGHVALHFAVTRPHRTRALALVNSAPRLVQGEGYPHGRPADEASRIVAVVEQGWGTGAVVANAAPNLADDRELCARMERRSASPGVAAAVMKAAFASDVRPLLKRVECPALVFFSGDLTFMTVEDSRYLRDNISGAEYVEAEGGSFYWADDPEPSRAWNAFVTGHDTPSRERRLGTVLFTDIVGSTQRAAAIGDERWLESLAAVDAVVMATVQRMGGSVVNTAGDGHLALFDDPEKALEAGRAICASSRTLDVEFRAGVHTGALEIRPGGDVAGIAVHTAARVMATAGPSELWTTRTVAELCGGSGLEFADRGTHELKGVPGEWQLFEVIG